MTFNANPRRTVPARSAGINCINACNQDPQCWAVRMTHHDPSKRTDECFMYGRDQVNSGTRSQRDRHIWRKPYPRGCSYSGWVDSGECSTRCGVGTRNQTRSVTQYSTDGSTCNAPLTQQVKCQDYSNCVYTQPQQQQQQQGPKRVMSTDGRCGWLNSRAGWYVSNADGATMADTIVQCPGNQCCNSYNSCTRRDQCPYTVLYAGSGDRQFNGPNYS